MLGIWLALSVVLLAYAVTARVSFVRSRRTVNALQSEILNYRVLNNDTTMDLDKYMQDCSLHSLFQSYDCRLMFNGFMRGIGVYGVPGDTITPEQFYQYALNCVSTVPTLHTVYNWFSKAYTERKLSYDDKYVLKNMIIVAWPHFVLRYKHHQDFALLRNTYMSRFDLDVDDLY